MTEERKRGGFESVDHTADVALRAWGQDMEAVFQQAAAGLIDLMLDPDTVRPAEERKVEAEAEEPDELLVDWLSEIHYLFEGKGFAPAEVEIQEFAETRIRGTLRGEPLDREKHETRTAIKAVTYHDLKFERTDRGYEVRIVCDV